MKIKVLRTAFTDIAWAQEFYEQQRNGLGIYFQDSIFADYYKIDAGNVIVWHVIGCRAKPSRTKEMLKN